jgi:DNA-binding NarL/FixJ family response regulator
MAVNPTEIRIVVVDDHPVIRDIIRLACERESGLTIVGEAHDGESALEACRTHRPDVLVLDLVLPGIDGFEVIRRISEDETAPRVLVVSGKNDEETVFRAARAGARGFLPKTVIAQRVVDAIRDVAAGETVYSDEQERLAIGGFANAVRRARESSRVAARLTERDFAVLGLLAEGLTNGQIARRLGVSVKTVESRVSRIYRGLGARTRVEAVNRAVDLQLVAESLPSKEEDS